MGDKSGFNITAVFGALDRDGGVRRARERQDSNHARCRRAIEDAAEGLISHEEADAWIRGTGDRLLSEATHARIDVETRFIDKEIVPRFNAERARIHSKRMAALATAMEAESEGRTLEYEFAALLPQGVQRMPTSMRCDFLENVQLAELERRTAAILRPPVPAPQPAARQRPYEPTITHVMA